MNQFPLKLVLLCVFFALNVELNATSVIDSLNQLLQNKEMSPANQAEIKLKLVKALRYRGAKADSLIHNTIAFSNKHQLLFYEARAKYYKTIYLSTIRKYEKQYLELIEFIDSVAQVLPQHKILKINAGKGRAIWHWSKQEYGKAVGLYKSTLTFAESNQMEEFYLTLQTNLAHNLGLNNQFFEALKYYQLALDHPKAKKSGLYANMINLYRRLQDWPKVIEYAELTKKYAIKEKRKSILSIASIQKGRALVRLKKYEEAEQELINSLPTTLTSTQPSRNKIVHAELLRIYLAQQKYDKMLSFQDSLKVVDKTWAYSEIVSLIGMAHLQKNNYQKALFFCEEGKRVAMNHNSTDYLKTACECLNEAYPKVGQYKKAHENLLLFNEATAKLNEREKIMNLSRALNQQELKQQEELLSLKQAQQEESYQSQISKYKLGGFLGLLLLGLASFTVYRIRKNNQQIKNQNKVINQSLKEKEILLKEIHHRVKNNLQVVSGLLKWQSNHIEDELALDAINEGQTRVQSMAIIHQKLYQEDNLTGIDMADYIQRLCESLFHSYNINADNITLDTSIDQLNLDIDTVIPLGLILNELISNALKHAFNQEQKGKLLIKLSHDQSNDELLLNVQDNGKGFDKDKINQESSFGWELIETLSEKLEGDLSVKNQDGTLIQLKIKNYKIA